MSEGTTRYLGLDVHKATITVAVAEESGPPAVFGTNARGGGRGSVGPLPPGYGAAGERDRRRRQGARSLYERAPAVRERVLGPDHLYTARTRQLMAMALRDEGEPAAAEALLQRAVRVYESALTANHPWLIESRRAMEDHSTLRPGPRRPRSRRPAAAPPGA